MQHFNFTKYDIRPFQISNKERITTKYDIRIGIYAVYEKIKDDLITEL